VATHTKSAQRFVCHHKKSKPVGKWKERKALIIYHCCRFSRPLFARKKWLETREMSCTWNIFAFKSKLIITQNHKSTHANISRGILILQLTDNISTLQRIHQKNNFQSYFFSWEARKLFHRMSSDDGFCFLLQKSFPENFAFVFTHTLLRHFSSFDEITFFRLFIAAK
jgi:hypothetical protein